MAVRNTLAIAGLALLGLVLLGSRRKAAPGTVTPLPTETPTATHLYWYRAPNGEVFASAFTSRAEFDYWAAQTGAVFLSVDTPPSTTTIKRSGFTSLAELEQMHSLAAATLDRPAYEDWYYNVYLPEYNRLASVTLQQDGCACSEHGSVLLRHKHRLLQQDIVLAKHNDRPGVGWSIWEREPLRPVDSLSTTTLDEQQGRR